LGLKTELGGHRDKDEIRACGEASRRGTRSVIAGHVSKGSKTVVDVCPFNGNIGKLDQIIPEECVSSFYVVGVMWCFASTVRLHIYSSKWWIVTHPCGLLPISFAQ
jgi:hypothetical protein